MKNKRIIIFDTTLRDGEQCPGASMNLREKLEVARQIKGPIICGLARCVARDIDAAGAALKPAGKRGRIHVFLATSKIHREFKFQKAQDEILRLAVDGVKHA